MAPELLQLGKKLVVAYPNSLTTEALLMAPISGAKPSVK